jgi:hypothetical protein
LRDVVEPERSNQPAASRVGDREEQEVGLERGGDKRACSERGGEQERRARADAVEDAPTEQAGGAADEEDPTEDCAERRQGPVRVGRDRLDQDAVRVVAGPVSDDREEAERRDDGQRRPRRGLAAERRQAQSARSLRMGVTLRGQGLGCGAART